MPGVIPGMEQTDTHYYLLNRQALESYINVSDPVITIGLAANVGAP